MMFLERGHVMRKEVFSDRRIKDILYAESLKIIHYFTHTKKHLPYSIQLLENPFRFDYPPYYKNSVCFKPATP